jgi:heptosyltransferase I
MNAACPTIHLGQNPRILLVRLSAIGDVVVATPVIRALRQAYPSAYLAWVVEEKAADVVRGNPDLDDVIVWPRLSARGHGVGPAGRWYSLRQNMAFVRDLRRRRFDVAVDFQGLLRSALVTWAAGAGVRIASEGTREGSALLYTIRVPRGEDPSSRQRCLDLLRPLAVASTDRRMHLWFDDQDRHAASRLLQSGGVGSRFACLCPATTWRHKHWREEQWAALADRLARECDLHPVFMGAAGDRPMIDRIRGRMSASAFVAAGETTLKQAAALLERADLVVAVDTALMHIGVAVGTPVIGVCGPSYWPGFQDYEQDGDGRAARFRLVREPYPCSPCLRHPTCQNDDCMAAIQASDVFEAAREVLRPGMPILRVLR